MIIEEKERKTSLEIQNWGNCEDEKHLLLMKNAFKVEQSGAKASSIFHLIMSSVIKSNNFYLKRNIKHKYLIIKQYKNYWLTVSLKISFYLLRYLRLVYLLLLLLYHPLFRKYVLYILHIHPYHWAHYI